ncbi:MAG: methyltransferase [Candidatus Hodarchaeales archaeon]
MLNTDDIKQNRMKLFFEKQGIHFILLILLLIFVYFLTLIEGSLTGSFAGLKTEIWFIIALVTPIVHQIYVWIFWRLQLYYNWITTTFGKVGFHLYAMGFFLIFFFRFFSILFLALSNADSVIGFQLAFWILTVIITFPTIYTFYSVKHYFGALRATGADHFDISYRSMPLVKEGIFKYTSNGMYWFGLLVLWIPGLVFTSIAALIVALFNHLYIWVHYYTVEKPDMNRIYTKN